MFVVAHVWEPCESTILGVNPNDDKRQTTKNQLKMNETTLRVRVRELLLILEHELTLLSVRRHRGRRHCNDTIAACMWERVRVCVCYRAE